MNPGRRHGVGVGGGPRVRLSGWRSCQGGRWPDASAPIGEAVWSWPEPELVLWLERWAEGSQGLKRVLRSVEFRLLGRSRKKMAVLLGRALAWKPVPEGPRVYEPDSMSCSHKCSCGQISCVNHLTTY